MARPSGPADETLRTAAAKNITLLHRDNTTKSDTFTSLWSHHTIKPPQHNLREGGRDGERESVGDGEMERQGFRQS